jgi:DNA-binding MarR family transcriptional regulator
MTDESATPDADTLEQAALISQRLDAIGRIMRSAIWRHARAQPGELTPSQVLALEVLVRELRDGGSGLSLSQLSARMGLAHSTTSGIVDRLAKRGLVRRAAGAGDKRFVSVELTEPVRGWLESELPVARHAPLAAALSKGSADQRAAIVAGLRALHSLLDEAERV